MVTAFAILAMFFWERTLVKLTWSNKASICKVSLWKRGPLYLSCVGWVGHSFALFFSCPSSDYRQCPGVFCKIESDISLAAISRVNMQHTFFNIGFAFGGKNLAGFPCFCIYLNKVWTLKIKVIIFSFKSTVSVCTVKRNTQALLMFQRVWFHNFTWIWLILDLMALSNPLQCHS